MKKEEKKPKVTDTYGPGHKVEYAVKENAEITKEMLAGWLKKDVQGAFITLQEILASKECMDALTEVFWTKYKRMHEAKQSQPEIFTDGN